MKLIHIFLITLFIFNFSIRKVCASNQITERTYLQLLRIVSKCSMSYCTAKGRLSIGKFPNTCTLESCAINTDVEVLKVFGPTPEEKGAAGYIAISHEDSEIYVVFRGTQTDADWISDVHFNPTVYKTYVSQLKAVEWECDNCVVHGGFYGSFASFMMEPFDFVLDLLKKFENYHLTITGHSLGGAWALLAGLEFKNMGYSPLVVSFGLPKISATYTFADKINEMFGKADTEANFKSLGIMTEGYFRVTHIGDKIPTLPPGYVHAGTELNIKKLGLPQEREDVVIVNANSSPETLQKKDISEVKKWLLKDHRDYFITVPGCS